MDKEALHHNLVPAHFKTKFNAQKAKKGDQVNLNCKAQGDKPITITWYKDGEILGNGTIPRYSKRQYDHHDGLTSQLNIHSVRREDSSVFSCRATNRYGHDDSTVELVVQELSKVVFLVQKEIPGLLKRNKNLLLV
ncbi:UNVERIFIED_CONTAM: Down syndrome cell adhesion molecule-like protein [Trichonephila clavipes]